MKTEDSKSVNNTPALAIRDMLHEFGGQAAFARRIGRNPRTVKRWASLTDPAQMPQECVHLLAILIGYDSLLERNPLMSRR